MLFNRYLAIQVQVIYSTIDCARCSAASPVSTRLVVAAASGPAPCLLEPAFLQDPVCGRCRRALSLSLTQSVLSGHLIEERFCTLPRRPALHRARLRHVRMGVEGNKSKQLLPCSSLVQFLPPTISLLLSPSLPFALRHLYLCCLCNRSILLWQPLQRQ